jgi:hypothetical protein
LKKTKFKISTQNLAVVLLGTILLGIVGMVVYEAFKAGTKDNVAVVKSPLAVNAAAAAVKVTPTPSPVTTYTLAQGLDVIKAVYADGSGMSNKNRQYIEDAFYTKTKNNTLDPINCEIKWPPSGGITYETFGITSGGIAAYVATEHWGGTEGDHRLAVYVNLNTDKISDVVCPAFHSGPY